ncbi:RloB domain-containing protein [Lamprobacter modestohalophilus]|uniref:RloB domain-containing protein n=1 Tax=Lamprobacter modestohalophilus TaxID=1064514 RepID=UPI002ADEF03D|nr:RloB domain-containing protein [Lamprobacter modestohalophilus]MEA1052862.1 RloB domain-containing protein [Lamprobacter modestohalophilus]
MSRRRPRHAQSVRHAKTTVLAVGEGDSEEAFLRYLKGLYAPRQSGVAVTVRNARGKGPQHVIDYAIGQAGARAGGYDLAAALIDTDLDCPPTYRRKAKRHQLQLVWSEPCFEGLLLAILDQHVPSQSSDCKKRFDHQYGINRYDPEAYAALFPRERLEERRHDLPCLNALCALMEGMPQSEARS